MSRRKNHLYKGRFGVSMDKNILQTLDSYCKKEHRSRSNMLEVIVKAYDDFHKTKY